MAHEAISLADWKAQNTGRGKSSSRLVNMCFKCRVYTEGVHPNAYCCLKWNNEEGNHLGMCKSKLGGPALKYINRSFDELCVVKAKTIVV